MRPAPLPANKRFFENHVTSDLSVGNAGEHLATAEPSRAGRTSESSESLYVEPNNPESLEELSDSAEEGDYVCAAPANVDPSPKPVPKPRKTPCISPSPRLRRKSSAEVNNNNNDELESEFVYDVPSNELRRNRHVSGGLMCG